jgi:hypothetical protein
MVKDKFSPKKESSLVLRYAYYAYVCLLLFDILPGCHATVCLVYGCAW